MSFLIHASYVENAVFFALQKTALKLTKYNIRCGSGGKQKCSVPFKMFYWQSVHYSTLCTRTIKTVSIILGPRILHCKSTKANLNWNGAKMHEILILFSIE